MSPSSKFTMRLGRHGHPRVCHPPPPPPPILPIPPPTCPPTAISGYIDTYWGEDYDPQHYYSPYTAQQDPEEPTSYYHLSGTEPPCHEIHISLSQGSQTLTIDLNIDLDRYHFKDALPFVWCQHQNLVCDAWDEYPEDMISLVVTLDW